MSFVVNAVKSVGKAVGGAVSGVVKAIGSVVSGVVSAVGSIVSSVINFVLSPFLGMFGMPDVPTGDPSAGTTGVLVQRSGTAQQIPVVYGYRKVGGIVTFAETGADNNKYFWVAYVLSEGACEGLKELWINDIQVPASDIPKLNAGQIVTISDANNRLKGVTTLQFWAGSLFNNPSSTGVGSTNKAGIFAGAPSWTTDMNYNGLCTVFARYEWKQATTQAESDNNPFGGGIPDLKACLLGRKVASLISGTPESYNYYAFGGGYTERYSTNPAEIILDYLRNPYYGKGLYNDDIDWDSFRTAAAKCNQEVEYVTGVKGPILTMNKVVQTNQTIFNNVKGLLQNFRAYLPYSAGKYKLKIEDAGNPIDILSGSAFIAAQFDKDNIQGDITYTGIDRASKYSHVVVTYVDPDKQWTEQTVTWPEAQTERDGYTTIDGGRENKGSFTFDGITNYAIAKDMARLIFGKNREQDAISLTVSSQAFELEPGDNIYINANLLKFGTNPNAGAIPWRIISIKLNNDYTFSLGCVRNPDNIYPHVRKGEIDYKFAAFIPKGATRYYPPEPTGIPVGLRGPSNAPRDSGTTANQQSNGAATNPTASAGGGVGGPSSPANSSGNINTTPTPAANQQPLNQTIKITKSSYSIQNGSIYATLEFYQPTDPMYDSVSIYYKRMVASETVWNQVDVTIKPGSDRLIQIKIGPLLKEQYRVRSRVKYVTGDYSTQAGDAYINPTDAAGSFEDPVDYAETVTSGWTLLTGAKVNAADATIATVTAFTNLSAGIPTTPRSLNFSIKQDIDKYGQNTFVNGISVYYKASTATYWKQYDKALDNTYVAGQTTVTFTLTGLGVPSYPNTPTAQRYDFVIRYQYNDNKGSIYQYRIMNVPVENNGIGYNYNAFLQVIPVGTESVGAYSLITEANAPPGSVADARNITIGLKSAETFNQGTNNIRFFFNPPDVANQPNWYGVRVYYRQVQPGANPAFSTKDFTPANRATTGEWSFGLTGIDYTVPYQYVIVPIVEYSGRIEATNCWSGQGQVHQKTTAPDYPSNNDWLPLFNMKSVKTTDAVASLSTGFPITNPVPSVLAWKRINLANSAKLYKDWYYQLRVQCPTAAAGFQELHIYRRANNQVLNAQASGTALYYGIGRWEKVTVTTSTHSFDANGVTTINLRGCVDVTEFDRYYEKLASSPTLVDNFYSTKKPINETNSPEEFILVLKVSGTVSIYGMLLPYIQTTSTVSNIDGLALKNPETVTLANYNTFTAGYQRNLTDFRTPVAITDLYAFNNLVQQSNAPTTLTSV